MVHDYHLYTLPAMVRRERPDVFLHHFVHIPWTQSDAWRVLPKRDPRRRSSTACWPTTSSASTRAPTGATSCSAAATCWTSKWTWSAASCSASDREVWVRAYPLPIDYEATRAVARRPGVAEFEEQLMRRRREYSILRVDRADLSKNVLRGFTAFDIFLEQHPEFVERITFTAQLMPSRTDVPEYAEYLEKIEALVAVVNHRHGTTDWMPIDLKLRDDLEEAVASYKHYDVMMVNAMFDGMNLVAKEGPLVNERDGVSILSENTGAHEELGEFALSVNPFDVQELADAIYAALTMSPEARARRAAGLKEIVTSRDPGDWIDEQIADIRAKARGAAAGVGASAGSTNSAAGSAGCGGRVPCASCRRRCGRHPDSKPTPAPRVAAGADAAAARAFRRLAGSGTPPGRSRGSRGRRLRAPRRAPRRSVPATLAPRPAAGGARRPRSRGRRARAGLVGRGGASPRARPAPRAPAHPPAAPPAAAADPAHPRRPRAVTSARGFGPRSRRRARRRRPRRPVAPASAARAAPGAARPPRRRSAAATPASRPTFPQRSAEQAVHGRGRQRRRAVRPALLPSAAAWPPKPRSTTSCCSSTPRSSRSGATRSSRTSRTRSTVRARSSAATTGASAHGLRGAQAQRGRLPPAPVPRPDVAARAARPQPQDHGRHPALPDHQAPARHAAAAGPAPRRDGSRRAAAPGPTSTSPPRAVAARPSRRLRHDSVELIVAICDSSGSDRRTHP